MSSPQTSLERK
uniref:Uncharacterized protein n=1 Tax=Arundo donax TaxID=35708 RepID=A0A0A8YJT8_ARUDO